MRGNASDSEWGEPSPSHPLWLSATSPGYTPSRVADAPNVPEHRSDNPLEDAPNAPAPSRTAESPDAKPSIPPPTPSHDAPVESAPDAAAAARCSHTHPHPQAANTPEVALDCSSAEALDHNLVAAAADYTSKKAPAPALAQYNPKPPMRPTTPSPRPSFSACLAPLYDSARRRTASSNAPAVPHASDLEQAVIPLLPPLL